MHVVLWCAGHPAACMHAWRLPPLPPAYRVCRPDVFCCQQVTGVACLNSGVEPLECLHAGIIGTLQRRSALQGGARAGGQRKRQRRVEQRREGEQVRTCSTFARHSCVVAQQQTRNKRVWRAIFC